MFMVRLLTCKRVNPQHLKLDPSKECSKFSAELNLVKQFIEIQGGLNLVKQFFEIQGLDISTPLRLSGRLGQRYDFEELFTAIEQHVNNF